MRGRWTAVFTALVAAVLITVFSLSHSLELGRLSFLPAYDDLVYLVSSLQIRDTLVYKGLFAGLEAAVNPQHHAPLFSALGGLGFALFGTHDFAPYASLGLPLFLVLWLCARRLRPFSGDPVATALFLALCLAPLLQMFVAEFRPDFCWGLFVSYGVFRVYADWVEDEDWAAKGWPWEAASVFALGAVLKSFALFGSIAFLIGACMILIGGGVLSWLGARVAKAPETPSLRTAAILAGKFALLATAISAPWLYWQVPHIYSYTVETMFTLSHVWGQSMSLGETLAFYPNYVLVVFGGSLVAVGAVWAGTLAAAARSRRAALWLVGAFTILVMAYVIPTAPKSKAIYFGAPLFGGVLWSAVFLFPVAAGALFRAGRASRMSAHPLLARALALAVAAGFVLGAMNGRKLDASAGPSRASAFDVALDANRRAILGAVLKLVDHARSPAALFPRTGPVTIYSNTIGPFDFDTVRYAAVKGGLRVASSGNFFSVNVEEERARALSSDLLVLPEMGALGLQKFFPGHAITDAVDAAVASAPRFVRLRDASWGLPPGIRLYARDTVAVRADAGAGWRHLESSGGAPPARRTEGARAEVVLRAVAGVSGLFRMACKSEAPRAWTVRIGEAPGPSVRTDPTFAEVAVPFTVAAGGSLAVEFSAEDRTGEPSMECRAADPRSGSEPR